MDENLSQVCSIDEGESKSVIVDESSTEKNELECVHEIVNKEKKQIIKQSMRNIWLRIIHLSRSQYILSYSNVVRIS